MYSYCEYLHGIGSAGKNIKSENELKLEFYRADPLN